MRVQSTNVGRICAQCGTHFTVPMWATARGRSRYCQKSCVSAALRAAADARLQDRFWANVVKTETCWLWIGGTNGHGYGRLSLHRKLIAAHRLALEWALGRPLAAGMESLHSCDVRNCVRNDGDSHLFEGTQAVNMDDMASKGRAPKPKLTPDSIAHARQRIASGATQRDVARELGVAQSTLRNALIGKTWRRVA